MHKDGDIQLIKLQKEIWLSYYTKSVPYTFDESYGALTIWWEMMRN